MSKQEELQRLYKLRGLIMGVLEGSIQTAELDSYTYGDADGSQSVKRRNPKDLMQWLNDVDAKIEKLERVLSGGGGIMTFGTNRYAGQPHMPII